MRSPPPRPTMSLRPFPLSRLLPREADTESWAWWRCLQSTLGNGRHGPPPPRGDTCCGSSAVPASPGGIPMGGCGTTHNVHRAQTARRGAWHPAGGRRGPCLLCYVESVAVGLGVGPAAAEGLPQDGVVGLLDPLQQQKESSCEEPGGPRTHAGRGVDRGATWGAAIAHTPRYPQGGGL